jgi:GNAT superfamily N-acetyltransferase
VKLTVRPVTPALWPALEDLFGPRGACNGCWCMYWRIGPAYHRRPHEDNRRDLRARVRAGPPPGLLAFDGDRAVGWCQLTPRDELAWLERNRVLGRIDDAPVWSLSCLYVQRGYRKRGVAQALVAAAVKEARREGAPAIEAYPVDTAVPGCTRNDFTGTAATFARHGFVVVARRKDDRPVMRRRFRGSAGARRTRATAPPRTAPPRPAPRPRTSSAGATRRRPARSP